jgi:hypothetical protein
MMAACAPRETRFQLNIHTPMNVDSTKKATVASMASGAPKISPTNFAYSAQFMPNWNSSVMPVTTPTAKFTRSRRLQYLVILRNVSSPVRAQRVSMNATMTVRPRVRGTKRKWNKATVANCNRDSTATLMLGRYHGGCRGSTLPRRGEPDTVGAPGKG